MVFSSFTFLLLFLPVVLLLNAVSTNIKWRNAVLLVASLIFYGWGEPVYILCMLLSTFVNYIAAIAFTKTKNKLLKKVYLTIGVIMSVAFLFYFKYAAFLFNSIAPIFSSAAVLPVLELPIGISFYTFQILTYTVDVYRGKAKLQKNFFDLLLYVSCFPQLIAGPIVQYSDVESMIEDRSATTDDIAAGLKRFVVGLAKKILLANVCGSALEQLNLANGDAEMSICGAWFAAVLYGLQLYYDFSAYSDMAIGIGRVLGFTYKENFNYPYISKSISEFWRRWHISLGAFFRDYVYIPLGGNRVGKVRLVINLLIVWSLTGFWHGASWNFLAWGAYYGVIIILERLVFSNFLKKAPAVILHIYSIVLILAGWVLFYYIDIADCFTHLLAMVGLQISEGAVSLVPFIDDATIYTAKQYALFYPVVVFCALPILPWIKAKIEKSSILSKLCDVGTTVALTALLALSVITLVGQTYNPFIYFRF